LRFSRGDRQEVAHPHPYKQENGVDECDHDLPPVDAARSI
jgi:hypothetical protein